MPNNLVFWGPWVMLHYTASGIPFPFPFNSIIYCCVQGTRYPVQSYQEIIMSFSGVYSTWTVHVRTCGVSYSLFGCVLFLFRKVISDFIMEKGIWFKSELLYSPEFFKHRRPQTPTLKTRVWFTGRGWELKWDFVCSLTWWWRCFMGRSLELCQVWIANLNLRPNPSQPKRLIIWIEVCFW